MKNQKNLEKIGTKIQVAREGRSLTRSALAKKIGETYREILRWETSNQEPKFSTLNKIAQALNIDINFFSDDMDGGTAAYWLIYYIPDIQKLASQSDAGVKLLEARNAAKSIISNFSDYELYSTAEYVFTHYVSKRDYPKLLEMLSEISLINTGESSNKPYPNYLPFIDQPKKDKIEMPYKAYEEEPNIFKDNKYADRFGAIWGFIGEAYRVFAARVIIDYSEILKADEVLKHVKNIQKKKYSDK
jgi:transcriptional regulator with XRE-family HTH domain